MSAVADLALGLVVGLVIGFSAAHMTADDHEGPECAHLRAVITDPESAVSRTSRDTETLEQAWEKAGCR